MRSICPRCCCFCLHGDVGPDAVGRVLHRHGALLGGQRLSPALHGRADWVMAALLSAVFSNDVICLAMTPVVACICLQTRAQPGAVSGNMARPTSAGGHA